MQGWWPRNTNSAHGWGALAALHADQRRYLAFIRPQLLTDAWQAQAHLEASIPHAQMHAIAQFWLRAAKLQANMDRELDREFRRCKRCAANEIDDAQKTCILLL